MSKRKKKPPERIKGVNASGKEQLHIRDIRMLESYGLTPVSKRGEHLYELRDREGNIVAGAGYTFGKAEVTEYVRKLKVEHPLYLPADAQGLYYPGLFQRCEKLYYDAKRRGYSTATKDLWHAFVEKYREESRQRHQEYIAFIRCGLCYSRRRASMYNIVAWMLSVIRKRDTEHEHIA